MEANQILTSDMLEILFEHRNKTYGAYELRKSYNKRMGISLIITGGIIVILFLLSLTAKSKETTAKHRVTDSVTIIQYNDEKVIDVKPLTSKPQIPKVASKQFTPTKIEVNSKVADEDVIPELQELSNGKIDVVTADGIIEDGDAIPNVDKQKGVIEPIGLAHRLPFTKVEVEASFTGNWRKYLERNLTASIPVQNGARAGSYTVIIRFIVDVDGNVSDVKALTSHGFGMEEESIRVIKAGPKWEPAIQNGRKVNAYRKQPITFLVSED
jgi:protein TonB